MRYREMAGRAYGPLLNGPRSNVVLAKYSSFLHAAAVLTTPTELERMVSEVYNPSIAQSVHRAIIHKEGHRNTWDASLDDVESMHAGNVMLNGKLPSYTGDTNVSSVSIRNFHNGHNPVLTSVTSSSDDHHFDAMKAYDARGIHVFDKPAALLLTIAHTFPHTVPNLSTVLENLDESVAFPFRIAGQSVASYLVSKYVHKSTDYAFDSTNTTINVLAPWVCKAFENDEARMSVLAQSYPFKKSSETDHSLKQWLGSTSAALRTEGFKPAGIVREFAGTSFETLGVGFVRDNVYRSLVFFTAEEGEQVAPFMVERTDVFKPSNQLELLFPQQREMPHPISFMFRPQTSSQKDRPLMYNDATLSYGAVKVMIPTYADVPDWMNESYRALISENYEGGIDQARKSFHSKRLGHKGRPRRIRKILSK